MLGALLYYLVHANPENFSPMNANYGIFPRSKRYDREAFAAHSLSFLRDLIRQENL